MDRSNGGYEITGVFERLEEDWVSITELPLKKWTNDYKKFLEEFIQQEDSFVTDIKEYHTENRVHFKVKIPDNHKFTDHELTKKLKLQTTISLNNLVLFNKDRKIAKYANISEIMEEHFLVREDFYKKRKELMISKLAKECEILSNKVRFILAVVNGELIINKKQKAVLVKELYDKKFTTRSQLDAIFTDKNHFSESEAKETETEGETGLVVPSKEYDYLLSMPLWSLTFEKVENLKKDREERIHKLEILKSVTVFDMWTEDLDKLKDSIEAAWEEEENDRLNRPKVKAKAGNGKTKRPPKKNQKIDKKNEPKNKKIETKIEPEKKADNKNTKKKPPVPVSTVSDDDDKPLSILTLLGRPSLAQKQENSDSSFNDIVKKRKPSPIKDKTLRYTKAEKKEMEDVVSDSEESNNSSSFN